MKHTPIPPVRGRKPWSEYVAEATARQSGRAINTPFLTVSELELVVADLHMTALSDPAAKLAQQDAFYARYQVRRGDDRRGL